MIDFNNPFFSGSVTAPNNEIAKLTIRIIGTIIQISINAVCVIDKILTSA